VRESRLFLWDGFPVSGAVSPCRKLMFRHSFPARETDEMERECSNGKTPATACSLKMLYKYIELDKPVTLSAVKNYYGN
jgi:hypothetical protein